jgi:hypothetical protein
VGQGFRIGKPMNAEEFALYVPPMQERADARSQHKRA